MNGHGPTLASPRRGHRIVLCLLTLIVLVTAGIRLRLLELPLDRDEGEYAYFGQLLLQGIPPYATAYNFKMPGIYGIYAVMLAIFGQTPTGIHLGLLVVNAATIVLVFLVAVRLFTATAGVAASAAFAALSLSPRLFSPTGHAEHFVLPLALAGLLALLRAIESRRPLALFCSGALFGAALLVKQSGGAFALFAVLYVAARAPGDVRRRLRLSATVAAGALAPLATLCLLMALTGTFATFWFWTFTYAFAYATAVPLAKGGANLAGALGSILPTSYLAAGLAALGLSALVWDERARSKRAVVGLLCACSFLAVSAGLYFRNQYFVLLLPALALLAGIAVDSMTRLLSSVRAPVLRYGAAIALAAVPPLHLVYLERAILFEGTSHQIVRALYGRNPFPESVDVARYIRERTSREDRIAVVGSEPQIYFYADRQAATGYIYTYALMEPHPYAAAMQRQMIGQIEAANPRYVVFVKIWTSWLVVPESDQTVFRWFEDYRKRFDRIGVIDIITPQRTTYVWGPEAASYAPRSDHWLMVFERRAAADTIPDGGDR
ncbi:MAG: glycosyltransferase family 39 protein [candidate division NC10 bacterium]|jgi:hypothetical protein